MSSDKVENDLQKCEKIDCIENCLLCNEQNCTVCDDGYTITWDFDIKKFICVEFVLNTESESSESSIEQEIDSSNQDKYSSETKSEESSETQSEESSSIITRNGTFGTAFKKSLVYIFFFWKKDKIHIFINILFFRMKF